MQLDKTAGAPRPADEEEADRIDQFCFAVADVLRRVLGLAPSAEEDEGEYTSQQPRKGGYHA
jgi:hypothetical protein